ncbi:MAG: antitoxin [Proteobacteria bacterium]|nr:antitoxin [Pseudomonadota bacterium]
MNTKLTLTLDGKTIESAKRYAKEHKTSLSKLVEFYFRAIASDSEDAIERIPPITKGLSGIAAMKTSKTDKELLKEALNGKFL